MVLIENNYEIMNKIELQEYLIRLNTHYSKDDLRLDGWVLEEHDDPTYLLTEKELLDRSIGAVTAISDIYNKFFK